MRANKIVSAVKEAAIVKRKAPTCEGAFLVQEPMKPLNMG
jgi:hypothetical protein